MSNFYSVRFEEGTVRKPREENLIANFDRIRTLAYILEQPKPWLEVLNYLRDTNGLHASHFSATMKQMEDDLLIRAKYSPEKKLTLIQITEYGKGKLQRLFDQIEALKR